MCIESKIKEAVLAGITFVLLMTSMSCKQADATANTSVTTVPSEIKKEVVAATNEVSDTKMMEKGMDNADADAHSDDVIESVTRAFGDAKEEMKNAKDEMKGDVMNKVESVAEKGMNKTKEVVQKVETAAEKVVKQPAVNVPSTNTSAAKEKVQVISDKVAETAKPALPPTKEVVKQVEDVAMPSNSTTKAPVGGPTHKAFDELLSKNVSSSGKVNYKGFKADQAKLDAYIAEISQVNVKGLNRNEQLAFWINAYNAFTIKKIISNYPLASITELNGGKPWDDKFIKIGSKVLSLNNIENDIIRPQFNEPRIHFAVNCAAKSCPPLLNKAWTASNLESNFEKQTKAFVNDASQNTLDANAPKLSKIFEWYAEDFGDLKAFINKYASTKISSGATLGYNEYIWSLNN